MKTVSLVLLTLFVPKLVQTSLKRYLCSLSDEILWYELSENTPGNPAQSSQHIGGLANALQILHHYKQEWTEDDVVSIIDELTSMNIHNTNLIKKIIHVVFLLRDHQVYFI